MAALRSRLLKAICGDCAYTVRLTRKWLNEAGPPLCPIGHGALEVPDARAWDQSDWQERQIMAATKASPIRTIRDKWVTTRTVHTCAECREEIQSGDHAHHHVYSVAAELFNEYRHLNCAGNGNPQGR